MSGRNWGMLSAALAVAGGAVALGLAFYIHSSHPFAVGGNWHPGVAVSPQRLLAAAGLVMIIGGLVVLRSRVVGGILIAAPLVIALCFIYAHTYVRMTNLRVWAATIVLGLLAAVCAGLALQREVEPVGLAEAQAQAAREAAVDQVDIDTGPIQTPLA
jgi:hypothetical protein